MAGPQRAHMAHVINEVAGGIEKYVPAHQLTVYEVPEHHDGMMSDTGRRIISNRVRNIKETVRLYMEADRLFNLQKNKK